MVKQGNLLAMLAKVLEGAEKDPAAPALAEMGPSLTPKVGETDSIPTPDVPPTSKPKGFCVSRRTGPFAKKVTTPLPRVCSF